MKVETIPITINETQIKKTCLATCGLDRFLRIHDVETGDLLGKIFLKSRLNCLLFSTHEPQNPNKKSNENKKNKSELDEDQMSEINSEYLGTDDLWSDMDTIIEEHPDLKAMNTKVKRKAKERLRDFDSNSEGDDSDDNEKNDINNELDESDRAFLKPRPVKIKKQKKKF
jgi:hypothetical protein